MLTKLDHILLAIPEGAEDVCRPFYTDILGLTEIEKPDSLKESGGLWLRSSDGAINLHLGIDPGFKPATKAHPAFLTRELRKLSKTLESQGFSVKWNTDITGVTRFFSFDPVGNRIEFIAEP